MKDLISRPLQTQKNNINNQSTPVLNNLVSQGGNGDLRHYLMKNLHQKFVKENQKHYQLAFDGRFESEPTVFVNGKKSCLEDTMQSLTRDKPQENMMQTMSDFRLRGTSRPATKMISLREKKTTNQFYIKSLSNLDSSTQISSLKEIPTTMKSICQEEDKTSFFTTNIQESSLVGKRMTIKKLRS